MPPETYETELEYREFDIASREEVALLAEWSSANDAMIPLHYEGLAHHQLATGAYWRGELAGYAAISVVYSHDVIELGGLVVNPALRQHRVGTGVVQEVLRKAHDEFEPSLILAFGNETSARLFKRLGAVVIDDIESLPSEVWKLCHICPRYEAACLAGKQCCDRALDLTPIPID